MCNPGVGALWVLLEFTEGGGLTPLRMFEKHSSNLLRRQVPADLITAFDMLMGFLKSLMGMQHEAAPQPICSRRSLYVQSIPPNCGSGNYPVEILCFMFLRRPVSPPDRSHSWCPCDSPVTDEWKKVGKTEILLFA